jgi:phosphatidylinositol alpha-1,6-mannosyltransferase
MSRTSGSAAVVVGRAPNSPKRIELIQYSLPAIVRSCPKAILLIVGEVPKNALFADAVTEQELLAVAEASNVASHIRLLGCVSDEELQAIYSASDVHIFPVLDDSANPEGFGMVAVEAAANGVPTVAFAAGGLTDAVAPGKSGLLVKANDYAAFAAAVKEVLGSNSYSDTCIAFAKEFEWDKVGGRLWQVIWQ